MPYRLIEHGLPTQRGNVRLSNLRGLNAIVSVTEQGGQWRGRPTRVGRRAHDLHPHASLVQRRRTGSGLRAGAACADRPPHDRSRGSGPYRSHGASGWNRGAKQNGPPAIGKPRAGWTTTIYLVAADVRTAVPCARAHPARLTMRLRGARSCAGGAKRRGRCPCRWTGPTKAMSPGNGRALGLIPVVPPAEPGHGVGGHPRPVQAAHRDRTAVPPPQGLAAPRLTIRNARRQVCRM